MNFSLGNNLFRKAIYTSPKQLSPEFCKSVINKFEQDPNIHPGVTAGGHAVGVKQSTDLMISELPEWEVEDKVFCNALSNGLYKYEQHMNNGSVCKTDFSSGFDIGYQIQRTSPGGFYDWHHDASMSRFLTFIFYLNDVNHKGYTEFCDGTRVQPKAGKLLIFPATHQYLHRGVPPKDELKYLMTGWIYNPLCDDEKVLRSSGRYSYLADKVTELESHLAVQNPDDPEHMGGHTPPEGDIANSYGS